MPFDANKVFEAELTAFLKVGYNSLSNNKYHDNDNRKQSPYPPKMSNIYQSRVEQLTSGSNPARYSSFILVSFIITSFTLISKSIFTTKMLQS